METLLYRPETKEVETKLIDMPDPSGLELEEVKVRDSILSTVQGRTGKERVVIEILSQVPLIPWLYHVVVASQERRGEEMQAYYAVLDSGISRIFKDQESFSVDLIRTLVS